MIEAGLGGRYDATSVIDSRVQVLTNVGLEHTRWLGPTERHIAEEKLAVVRTGGTLVTGRSARTRWRSRSAWRPSGARRSCARAATSAPPATRPLTVETPGGALPGIELRALGRFQRDELRRSRWRRPRRSSAGRSTPTRCARAARELVAARPARGRRARSRSWCSTAPTTRAARGRWRESLARRRRRARQLIAVDLDPRGQGRGRDAGERCRPLCDGAVFTRSLAARRAAAGDAREPVAPARRAARGEIVADPAEALATRASARGRGRRRARHRVDLPAVGAGRDGAAALGADEAPRAPVTDHLRMLGLVAVVVAVVILVFFAVGYVLGRLLL